MAILREATFSGVGVGVTATAANAGFDNAQRDGTVVGVAGLSGGGQAIRKTGTGVDAFYWHFAARTSLYARGYLKVDDAGTGNQTFAWVNQQAGVTSSRVAEVRFRSATRDFQIRNNLAAAQTTSATFALGDLIRWEWFVDRSAQTQTLRLFRTTNAEGATPSETITGPTGAGDATFDRFGCLSQLVATGTPDVTLDKVAIGDAWIGPYSAVVTPAGAYQFIEWNGTTAAVLAPYEWDGSSTLTALEATEQT